MNALEKLASRKSGLKAAYKKLKASQCCRGRRQKLLVPGRVATRYS